MRLTLLLEVVDVHVGNNKVPVLLDGKLVPLLQFAREHNDQLLIAYIFPQVKRLCISKPVM